MSEVGRNSPCRGAVVLHDYIVSTVNGHQSIAMDVAIREMNQTKSRYGSDVAMKDHGRRTTHVAFSSKYDPNAAPRRRDALIDEVTRELKHRHGGNDVLNRLEAEIIVDHYLERRPEQQRADATEIIRSARAASHRT